MAAAAAKQMMWEAYFYFIARIQQKIGSFGPPTFWRPIPQKSLLGFLLPAVTCHVLKFCKDPFRGVHEIGSKKATFLKHKDTRGQICMTCSASINSDCLHTVCIVYTMCV